MKPTASNALHPSVVCSISPSHQSTFYAVPIDLSLCLLIAIITDIVYKLFHLKQYFNRIKLRFSRYSSGWKRKIDGAGKLLPTELMLIYTRWLHQSGGDSNSNSRSKLMSYFNTLFLLLRFGFIAWIKINSNLMQARTLASHYAHPTQFHLCNFKNTFTIKINESDPEPILRSSVCVCKQNL